MAKQKKKRNKRYKKKYTTDNRLDMSKGGRVGYQLGKRVEEPNDRNNSMSIDRLPGKNENEKNPFYDNTYKFFQKYYGLNWRTD